MLEGELPSFLKDLVALPFVVWAVCATYTPYRHVFPRRGAQTLTEFTFCERGVDVESGPSRLSYIGRGTEREGMRVGNTQKYYNWGA